MHLIDFWGVDYFPVKALTHANFKCFVGIKLKIEYQIRDKPIYNQPTCSSCVVNDTHTDMSDALRGTCE